MDAELRKKEAYKITWLGFIVNVSLALFKLVAGIVGRSGAMIADAVHSVSDLVTDVIVLVFVKIAAKPSDEEHRYGHGKFETFATVVIAIILFAVGVGMLVTGVRKVHACLVLGEEIGQPAMIALWAAVISILAKEALYRYTMIVGKRIDSQAVVANAWHHRSDVFSSIATLAGISGAIFLGAKFAVLDPLAAALVSIFIIKVSIDLCTGGVNELVEKSLPKKEEQEIIAIITSIPEFHQLHNLRTRKVGNRMAIEVHVRVDKNMTVESSHALTCVAEKKLRERFGEQTFISIHVEPIK
jgi:cation diffusion facilitator family transporter